MTGEEIFGKWAPEDSIWSQWVIPVPFAQMFWVDGSPTEATQNGDNECWFAATGTQGIALVVDLPGAQAICYGLAAARRGIRPVPVIDGSPCAAEGWWGQRPGIDIVVDMRELLRGLHSGAEILAELPLASDAPPAFLLDANRDNGGATPPRSSFDNRWKTFPQDYPSARLLRERGIHRVIVIQRLASDWIREDLQHVLLRWQKGGITIQVQGIEERSEPREIKVSQPSWYRASWYRALAMVGLQRGAFGGFGNWPHGTGGG